MNRRQFVCDAALGGTVIPEVVDVQPEFEACSKVVSAFRNIYTDIVSFGFLYRMVDQLVKAVGSEKVLFGTDTPYLDPYSQYRKLGSPRLTDQEKGNIFFHNAQRMLGRMPW